MTLTTETTAADIEPATFSAEALSDGPSTRAVHAGRRRAQPGHAITTPLVQSSTFTFANTADLMAYRQAKAWGDTGGRNEYGRYGNPTVRAAEVRLAALEGADDALLYPSGMAAITSVMLSMLPTGSHVVMTDDCYRRTRDFARTFLQRLGIETTTVPTGDLDTLEAAIRPETRLIVSETPTNPFQRMLDLPRVVEIARANCAKTLIDTTFATPVNLRPLDYGVDLVAHSATKYLAGHNDVLAGVVAGPQPIIDALREGQGVLGGVLDPHAAWLLERGLKTLGLRVARHNANGLALARFLEGHPRVRRVWYPGLESHPDHALAAAQMNGFGGVVTFELEGRLEDASRFVDALTIPTIAPSLGGIESLVEQVALMAYYEVAPEERAAVGITDTLIRYSAGVEDTDDLLADLAQALDTL
jgi:cystathionine gamma-synthase